MYAIIENGGKQYKAVEGGFIEIDLLPDEVGKKKTFDKVLLLSTDGGTEVGEPYLKSVSVDSTIVSHFKAPKIIEIAPSVVFHRKDLDHIIQETRELLGSCKKITVGDFRDHFNTTRKYAIALLEYLDENRITERIGDFRVLKTS